MGGIDWKSKLTSRKLWLAVGNLVTMVLIMLRVDSETVMQVVAILMASGGIIAFIFAEGWADVERERTNQIMIEQYGAIYDEETLINNLSEVENELE